MSHSIFAPFTATATASATAASRAKNMRVKEIALPYLSVHGCARDSRELRRAGVVWCVVRRWLRAMRLASFAANFWATLELGEGEGGGAVSRSLSDAAHVAGDGCRRACRWVRC